MKREPLELFLAAQPDLLRYAARMTGDPVEAEDVVQEAWLRFRATTSGRTLDEPKGYLFRIVHNLVIDRQRRQARERRLFAPGGGRETALVPSDDPSQHALAEARHDLDRLRAAMAQLPERTRRAFELHRFEGRKLVEIAAQLGISKSVAQTLVIDAVEFCKQALRRHH